MIKEPEVNSPENPMVSIFVYNYFGQYLNECLENIFQPNCLTNFEVILIDDASTDGSWDIALNFQKRFPNIITLQRNRKIVGPEINSKRCMLMSRGSYCTTLTDDQVFQPEHVYKCMVMLRSDPYVVFRHVHRVIPQPLPIPPEPLPSIMHQPLVSILCYNYNYGRYLRECLKCIFAQSYKNIELCFSDNASTDDSWEIALNFACMYPDKMTLVRNRKNFGPDDNFANCKRNMTGKYFVNFCSDDVLSSEYVEQCVSALEKYPNAGLAIVNRNIIDEHGNSCYEPPFYNKSCVIKGYEQAAVYMMAGVNPSVSQIMYRREIVDSRAGTGALVSRYYGTRILDFNISVDFDIVYLKDSLISHRIHSESDTNQADSNLMPIIGMYVLNHQLADIAAVKKLSKAAGRLPASIEKLAQLSMRYSINRLLANDELTAERYFYLAIAMNPQIVAESTWKSLRDYWVSDDSAKLLILDEFKKLDNLAARNLSYEPPPNSIPL